MKRIISILLASFMVICALSGCDNSSALKVMVEGAIFGGNADDVIEAEISFDAGRLSKKDNTKYDKDLAAACALLSADSYFREKDIEKGSVNRVIPASKLSEKEAADAAYEPTGLLKLLGFTETEHIESYKAKEYEFDSNDSTTLNLGYMTDGSNDIYAVVIRGCFSAGEWESSFDPGAAGEDYEKLTGEHPEWQDKDIFKGYDIALNRTMEFVDEFTEKHGSADAPDIFLITGHSRGGSLANVLGAVYEKEGRGKTFTYTFNAMAINTSAAEGAQTVFNVFDSNDFYVDLLPFANERPVRFGTDITADISGSISIKKAIANLKNRDDYTCAAPEIHEKYEALFGEMFPDRASVYEKKALTFSFDNKDDAQKAADEFKSFISADSGLNLEAFYSVGDVSAASDGKAEFTVEYCGGAVLRSFSKILAYGENAYGAVIALFEGDEKVCEASALLFENLASFNAGHLMANSYILAKKSN